MVNNVKSTKLVLILSLFFLNLPLLHAEQTRIMPLGDSITQGTWVNDTRPSSKKDGYRSDLWYKLSSVGYEADFVGSQINGESILPEFDPNHEGHPGWTSFEIAEYTYDYMTQSQPDVILLHIGTNDRGDYNSNGVASILDEVNIYEDNTGKSVLIYVALIIERQNIDFNIYQFNKNLHQLVGNRILNGDNLVLVDMYTNANLTSSDYRDNTHPNDNGYSKMATVWFDALQKPYNERLNAFPYTIVSGQYIQSLNTNNTSTTIEFITNVPFDGITF